MSTPGSTTWYSKCPSGAKWRTLPNGQIEVDGYGIPLAETTGYFQDAKFIKPVWDEWGSYIQSYAAKFGVPERWVLAIIIIESRGKNYKPNSAGAGGILALLQSTADMMLGRRADIMDPNDAFEAGVGLMAKIMRTQAPELPVVAVSYNAGSPKCSEGTRCKNTIDGSWSFDGTTAPNILGMVEDCTNGHSSAYSYRAVQINNSAVEMGIGGGGSLLAGLGVGSLSGEWTVAIFLAGALFAVATDDDNYPWWRVFKDTFAP